MVPFDRMRGNRHKVKWTILSEHKKKKVWCLTTTLEWVAWKGSMLGADQNPTDPILGNLLWLQVGWWDSICRVPVCSCCVV